MRILPNSPSGRVHAQIFGLLPHSLGKTTVNLIKTHIVLPNVENMLNFSEKDLLQPGMMQPVEKQHLDEIVERATARSFTQGTDVNKIVYTVRGKEMYRQPTSWSWIIDIIVLLTIIGILWFIWFKFTNKFCPCIWSCTLSPNPPHVITIVQELNECDTDL
jgi:hypothetical protein